jgi:hypothetical protein
MVCETDCEVIRIGLAFIYCFSISSVSTVLIKIENGTVNVKKRAGSSGGNGEKQACG